MKEQKIIRAALLDANNVYIGMDALDDESQLTDRHLPQIKECDLPINKYRWIVDLKNELGGAFVPLPKEAKKASTPLDVASLNALALTVWALYNAGTPLEQAVKDWFNEYIQTVDASNIARHSVLQDGGGAKLVIRQII